MTAPKLEPETEPEEATRPSPPVPEEQVATGAVGETAHPSSPPAPEEQATATAGREAPRMEEGEEEDDFEDMPTDKHSCGSRSVPPLRVISFR